MAGAYPNITGGYPARCPYTHRLVIPCNVKRFYDGKEQRFSMAGLLNYFRLPYSHLLWGDLSTLQTFWTNQKGAFDDTWSITLKDPKTLSNRSYANMSFDADAFTYTENPQQNYQLVLSASQTVAESVTVTNPTAYPTLNNGIVTQVPWTTAPSFSTKKQTMDSGLQYAWAAWTAPLTAWQIFYGAITDSELQSVVNCYLGAGGAVNSFSFTDPNTTTVHSTCRFGPEGLEITRLSPGANACKLTIAEYLA